MVGRDFLAPTSAAVVCFRVFQETEVFHFQCRKSSLIDLRIHFETKDPRRVIKDKTTKIGKIVILKINDTLKQVSDQYFPIFVWFNIYCFPSEENKKKTDHKSPLPIQIHLIC